MYGGRANGNRTRISLLSWLWTDRVAILTEYLLEHGLQELTTRSSLLRSDRDGEASNCGPPGEGVGSSRVAIVLVYHGEFWR